MTDQETIDKLTQMRLTTMAQAFKDLLEQALSTEYFVLSRWRNQEVPSGHREDSLFAEL